MSFTSWLKSMKAKLLGTRRNKPRAAPRTIRKAQLNAELLENRLVPTAVIEDFAYGAAATSLNGLGTGSGFAGNWSGSTSFQYSPTSLSFSDLSTVGGSVSVPANVAQSIERPLAAVLPSSSPFWGSYLFRINAAASDNSWTVGVLLGQSNDSDVVATYDAEAHSYSQPTAGARVEDANANTALPGSPLTTGTTYLYLFKANSGDLAQAMTTWVLTAAQYDTFKVGGITEAELNAASLGTGANQVVDRGVVNATGRTLDPASYLRLFAYFDPGMTIDRIRLSDVGLNQAINEVSISSVSPHSAVINSGQFTLNVNGTNYQTDSSVNWNGVPLTTTFVSSTQLTAVVPAADLAVPYGSANITVVNPTTSAGTSNPAVFYLDAPGATAPTLTAPTSASIAFGSATLGGTVAADNGSIIQKRGVLYAPTATNSNPTLGGAGVIEVDDAAASLGTFTENVSLNPNTGYSFVAFATNDIGTAYTSPVSTFSTPAPAGAAWTLSAGSYGNIAGYTFAETFSTSVPLSISALGIWDGTTVGLAGSHPVGLWNTAGTLLTSTTVLPGDTLLNGFRYHNLTTPYSLSPGTYVVGAFYGTSDEFSQPATTFSTLPGVTYLGVNLTYNPAGLTFPGATTNGGEYYFGADFLVAPANQPPMMTTQPTTQTVDALSTVSFTAAASGTPTPTVQWYVSTNNGVTFNPISGATSTTLSFTATGDMTGNQYEAIFTNAAGTITSSVATLTVHKLNATVTVNGYSGTFDAAAHGATGAATGLGGVNLGAGLNLGASFTNAPGGTAFWIFSGGVNYNDQSGMAAIVIDKATLAVNPQLQSVGAITINGYSGMYDGASHGATGSVVGVNGDLSAAGSTLDLGASFTNYPGGTAHWVFTGGTNYNNQDGYVGITITKADALVTVNGYSHAYDGGSHGATLGSITGVHAGGAAVGATWSSTDTFTNYPGGTAHWHLAGGTNYNDQDGTAAVTITKADALVTATGFSGSYDALPHGIVSHTVSGVSADPSAAGTTWSSTDTFTDYPGGTAHWHLAGGTNYNDQDGTAAVTITKANQTITWSNPAAINYGTALSGTQLNATVAGVTGGSAPGALTYTPPAGTVLLAGTQTLTVCAAATTNYNAALRSVSLVVNTYVSSGFLQPISLNRAFKQGSTVPIKWQLHDASGNMVTSLAAIMSLSVTGPGGTATLYSGNNSSSGATDLRNDGSQYVYNWQTKGCALRSYTITAALADGTHVTQTIMLSTSGAAAGLVIDGVTGTTAVGALLAGDMTVYVDNANGAFTAAELARIQDAVAGIEALVAPHGANLVQVDASVGTDANIVIDSHSTSVIGGAADGVLGVTQSTGEITLLQGWNWYAGSNSAGVGSGQYDFQTVVVHELGHSLGLGHSANAGSVMAPELGTGTARRTMAFADLAIAEEDGGEGAGLHAEPLLARGFYQSEAAFEQHLGQPNPANDANLLAVPTASVSKTSLPNQPARASMVIDLSGIPTTPLAYGSNRAQSLRCDTVAGGTQDALVGGAGDDLRIGAEGRDVLLGGFRSEQTSAPGDDAAAHADGLSSGLAEWTW
jgi:hypothetical protein